ncbi:MAG: alanine:cation symporter family protein [Gracilimonas sp.]|uniref:alanine/glycine:cation symporter family protein n=1 Tax=Gracilimonas TaxID=649462 RepID=UPI001B18AAF8|nr:alanine/glycine:cation symporter family protein [Gracilimonas sp.]MBO6584818.1 alanine:cation symporter family protein [Gracilimonas sp.]MBO6615911.1 alanine:cation symporter family protein [Gracilimonas sp.]
MWGYPLVILLVGGGLFFLISSGFTPFRFFFHAIDLVRGKYDNPDDPGDINHFEALSTALASTVGMGNISGVAVAIFMGGPGALFWMWMSAIVGMATKFFTCTLSIMYRGEDTQGKIQGGPMYVIREGLSSKWMPLAYLFAMAGLFGPLPIFQTNQLVQILRDFIYIPNGWVEADAAFTGNLITGIVLVGLVSLVIFGGITKIGKVASKLVPSMVVIYVVSVLFILAVHIADIPYYLGLIVTDAFTGKAVMGGAVGQLIIIGVQRAAFSNEAGIGTESLAHGASKTKEPVREGLVAMMEPAIDTLLVCTMTALAILVTGVWQSTEANGVTLTLNAFNEALPAFGTYLLIISVLTFSVSSMLSYSYYGSKCLGFLLGAERQHLYNYFYVFSIIFGAVASLDAVINLIDGMFALMAIPTVTSALLLSKKVRLASKDYFTRLKNGEFKEYLEKK